MIYLLFIQYQISDNTSVELWALKNRTVKQNLPSKRDQGALIWGGMGTGFGWDIVQHSRLLHAGAAWLLALCLPWALDVIQEGLAGTGTLGKRDPFPWQAENSNMWRQFSLCIFRSFPSQFSLYWRSFSRAVSSPD